MAFGNLMEDALDDFEKTTMKPTPQGLQCEITCTGCGHPLTVLEPWAPNPQNPNDSSVYRALRTPPA
jgi:hypothetical protein